MKLDDIPIATERKRLDGVQRIYALPNSDTYCVSLVNAPMLHDYPFAWEAAVLRSDGSLCYDSPLTQDVEVFQTDDDAAAFVLLAFAWARGDWPK